MRRRKTQNLNSGAGKHAQVSDSVNTLKTHETTYDAAQRPSGLVGFASAAIESIKINSTTLETRNRRTLLVKHRRWGSELVAMIANLFFWLSRSLHLNRKSLDAQALRAAARELRRAHGLRGGEFGGGFWSHGDPHLGNVVYDKAADRARLVDFEIIHKKSLSALERHADDLLVFLQDLVGHVSREKWLPLALCFVTAYGRDDVIAELTKLLVVPRGITGMWWKLRTEYLSRREPVRRFAALRRALCNHLANRNVVRKRQAFEFPEPWLKTA
jgi:hypothetical protein